ncbi:hypothetical protein D3C71_1600880 [compost metagenome]
MAVFCLTADIAHRLVEQDRDLLGLLLLRGALNLNSVGQIHQLAHRGDLAIDQHPPVLDPCIALAARTHAQIRQALVHTHLAFSLELHVLRLGGRRLHGARRSICPPHIRLGLTACRRSRTEAIT